MWASRLNFKKTNKLDFTASHSHKKFSFQLSHTPPGRTFSTLGGLKAPSLHINRSSFQKFSRPNDRISFTSKKTTSLAVSIHRSSFTHWKKRDLLTGSPLKLQSEPSLRRGASAQRQFTTGHSNTFLKIPSHLLKIQSNFPLATFSLDSSRAFQSNTTTSQLHISSSSYVQKRNFVDMIKKEEPFEEWKIAKEQPSRIFFYVFSRDRVAFQVHLKGAFAAGNHWWKNLSQDVLEKIPGSQLLQYNLNSSHNPDKMISEEFGSINQYVWTFPSEQYNLCVKRMQEYKPNLKIEPLPNSIYSSLVLNADRAPLIKKQNELEKQFYEKRDFGTLPSDLWDFLLPFQKEGVIQALARDGRALIGDEMGLGKTVQALAVAAYFRDEWPILVVVPSSLRIQWAEQFKTWIPGLKDSDVNVITTSNAAHFGSLVNIISYDLVVRLKDLFAHSQFEVIIADESHYLKNSKSLRTDTMKDKLREATRVLLLSGTPATTSPKDLFTQVSSLQPKIFWTFPKFALRYCNASMTTYGMESFGASNKQELNMLLERTVMIRRTKNMVLTQLPPKTRQKIELRIQNSKHRKAIADIFSELSTARTLLDQKRSGRHQSREISEVTQEVKNLLTQLYKKTGSAKLPFVLEYTKQLLDSYDGKFIIFAHHADVIDGICHAIGEQGVKFIRIDGSTPPAKRHDLINSFQNDSVEDCRIAVLSITAAGVGINLTAASLLIFAELYWTPGALLQAEDRIHRLGQTQSHVDIRYLVANDTCDVGIWRLLQNKSNTLGTVLDGTSASSMSYSRERPDIAPEDSTIELVLNSVLTKLDSLENMKKDKKGTNK